VQVLVYRYSHRSESGQNKLADLWIQIQVDPQVHLCSALAPSVLVFEINTRSIKVRKTLKYEQEGEIVVLDVRGLIYHGDFHFTSRIIGTGGIVWYCDGSVKMIEILTSYLLIIC
jgi:hypothetical protein